LSVQGKKEGAREGRRTRYSGPEKWKGAIPVCHPQRRVKTTRLSQRLETSERSQTRIFEGLLREGVFISSKPRTKMERNTTVDFMKKRNPQFHQPQFKGGEFYWKQGRKRKLHQEGIRKSECGISPG